MNDLSETESREYVPLRVALSLYCAILVLAVFPFTNNPTGDVKYLVTAWAAGLLVFFLSWSIWRGKVLRAGDGILLPLVAALAVVYVASLAQSLNVSWSLLVVCRLLAVALLCWVASRAIRTVAGAIALTKWFCIAVAVASLYGFLQRAGWDPLPWDESHKMLEEYKNMPATFGNPNLAGHVLVMATILSVAVGSLTGHRWLMLLAPLFVAHLLITQHRAGLIALASGAALYAAATLATRGLRRTPSASLFRTIALFSLFVVAGLVAGVAVMLARNGTLYPNDLSAFMRMNSVLSAAQMIVSRPILGFGAGMYPIENARYWTPFEQDWYAVERRLNTHAHSDVLETGVEAGLFGAGLHLAIALCAIGWCLYAFYTRERQEDRRLAIGMAAMFTAFAVDGIAGFPFRAPVSSGLYFVLIGVAHGVFATRTVSTGKPRSNARKLAPLLVLFALCAAIYMETRSFASQYLLLRGRGAAYWQEFAEAERVLGQALPSSFRLAGSSSTKKMRA
ncbi:MAG TPA: O-antigen ligase family protein, partial [Candidatus Hydrogenedentes bacterium]|nr:O-antigen ligase family protein [Candidatus Hydrogenedentota bacterium]